jgi:hypothetical protein
MKTHKSMTCFLSTYYLVAHSYDILGARMLWKPKEARILKNFIEFELVNSVIW